MPEGWQDKILDLYAEGMSDYEVMTEMTLHFETFKRLLTDPEFNEVVGMGRQKSRAWWERAGRVNLQNRDFNATLWKINVQNRLGWSDKTSTHEADTGFEKSLTADEIENEIVDLTRKLRVVNKEEVK